MEYGADQRVRGDHLVLLWTKRQFYCSVSLKNPRYCDDVKLTFKNILFDFTFWHLPHWAVSVSWKLTLKQDTYYW